MVDQVVLVDVEGLAPYSAHGPRLAKLIQGEPITDRLGTLARLANGAGVRVVTGPLGKDYWGLASVEVQVTVWPDDYDWKDRHDEWTWALIAAGLNPTAAKGLAKSHFGVGKTPTPKHSLYDAAMAAIGLRESYLEALAGAEALVYEPVAFDILTIDEGVELLRRLTREGTLAAVDWEWHRETQEPVGLAISTGDANYYVPVWGADCDNRSEGGWLQAEFRVAVSLGARFILHGGRADFGTQIPGDPLDLLGAGRYRADDTMVMAYLLGEPVLGLKPLCRKYLDRDPIENDYEWAEMPVRFTARYAAAGDTRNTYDLYVVLKEKLREQGQDSIYERFERPLVPIVASMERAGTPVDVATVKRMYREHVAIEYALLRSVQENYGRNLADDADTRAFIRDFGFADPGTLDQRVISLNPHWCIDLILEYRQTRTRRRNFLGKTLKRWVAAGKPDDFRLYPRFNQAGSMDGDNKAAPRTGRFSSSDPNLQNQPRAIREMFVPPKGCLWWSFDYSGLELHIAAGLSEDKAMLDALSNGKDLHAQFRAFITEKTGRDVGRPAAKAGNFEQLYEGGADQLVRILAKMRSFLPPEDADAIVESHHDLYAGYHGWGKRRVDRARDLGYAETFDGRRRYIEEYESTDGKVVSHGDRAAQNHSIQGTAADKVKEAMINLVPVLQKYGAHMAIQVHDELDGWIPETADVEAFEKEVREVMEAAYIPNIKLKVEGGIGKNWAEVH